MRKRLAEHPHREAFFRSKNWKDDEITVSEAGTFWLVRNQQIHIQGRYWKNATNPELANLGALAIGGPFLGDDNVLVVRTLAGGEVMWNDQAILHSMPSEFHNEYMDAKYHSKAEIVSNGHKGPGIEMELPMGVRLNINRWKQMLAVRISLCGETSEILTEGQCGNNNHDVHDDNPVSLISGASHGQLEKDEILFPDSRPKFHRIAHPNARSVP